MISSKDRDVIAGLPFKISDARFGPERIPIWEEGIPKYDDVISDRSFPDLESPLDAIIIFKSLGIECLIKDKFCSRVLLGTAMIKISLSLNNKLLTSENLILFGFLVLYFPAITESEDSEFSLSSLFLWIKFIVLVVFENKSANVEPQVVFPSILISIFLFEG